jgi:hypothetical protein
MVVKTLGNKAFQRLSSQHDTLERAPRAQRAARQLTETQLIADALRVLGVWFLSSSIAFVNGNRYI